LEGFELGKELVADTLRYVQVLESGQRHRLPDWLVWNEDASLLDGVATDADVGSDYVIMVGRHLSRFLYRYRRYPLPPKKNEKGTQNLR